MNNISAMGFAVKAAREMGMSDKKVRDLTLTMMYYFDIWSDEAAARYFHYGVEPKDEGVEE